MGFFFGLLGVGLLILKIWLSGRKTTITRPDGSTTDNAGSTEFYTPRQDGTASVVSVPRKRQIGPTTISFGYINERHATVNSLKQRYGSAVRIVHRGKKSEWDAWSGLRNVYTLIYEVPVKCVKCKESFSVEDFGFVDCPGCGLELAVYFDDTVRKKVIRPANGRSRALRSRGRVPRRTASRSTESESASSPDLVQIAAVAIADADLCNT